MVEKGPPAPTPKPGKTKIPVASQTTKKANTSLDPKVIIKPIDYNQGQNALKPPKSTNSFAWAITEYTKSISSTTYPTISAKPAEPTKPTKINLVNRIYQTNKICQINRINKIYQTYQINLTHQMHQTHQIHKTHLINQIHPKIYNQILHQILKIHQIPQINQTNQIQWICQTLHSHNRWIGLTLSQGFQVKQKKMPWHICWKQITGWTHKIFQMI